MLYYTWSGIVNTVLPDGQPPTAASTVPSQLRGLKARETEMGEAYSPNSDDFLTVLNHCQYLIMHGIHSTYHPSQVNVVEWHSLQRGLNALKTLYYGTHHATSVSSILIFLAIILSLSLLMILPFTYMPKVDIWTLISFLLIEQCTSPFSRYDHASLLIRLKLQRALILSESSAEGGFELH